VTYRFLLIGAVAAPVTLLPVASRTSMPVPETRFSPAPPATIRPADLQQEYRRRREALAAQLSDGVVLAIGAPEPRHDYLSFFQAPSFYYLTGLLEPDAALVMVKRGASVSTTMFVPPRIPAQEVWSGARLGTEGVARLTGAAARPTSQLRAVLDSLLRTGLPLHVIGDVRAQGASGEAGRTLTGDEQLVESLRRRHGGLRVNVANGAVERMRATKSPTELAFIRQAVEITVRAHNEMLRALEPGMNEFELEALIEYTFRRNGAERTAFASIVGSGPNSTTLHYRDADRFMRAGELVLMDVGASYRGYAADVTRTVPVSGRYSPEQRQIYETVLTAQKAAESAIRIGGRWADIDAAANRVIADGLAEMGLIDSPTAEYDCAPGQRCPQFRLYYMHGLGHGVGLDVHDPDRSVGGTFSEGSAFTIEPGIYVRGDVLDYLPDTPDNRAMAQRLAGAGERYRDNGVRIEDVYILTADGLERLSDGAPREVAEIEAMLAQPRIGGRDRHPEVVDWYRQTEPRP
jgi:Xaa-Pro aminopeptidase